MPRRIYLGSAAGHPHTGRRHRGDGIQDGVRPSIACVVVGDPDNVEPCVSDERRKRGICLELVGIGGQVGTGREGGLQIGQSDIGPANHVPHVLEHRERIDGGQYPDTAPQHHIPDEQQRRSLQRV